MGLFRRREREPKPIPWMPAAYARHEPEADLIVNLLREHGIGSYHKRPVGLDVPEFLATGPRVVMVRADEVDAAKDLLDVFITNDTPPNEPL